MLRVIRNHRRAAYNAPPHEYEGLTITPVGHRPRVLPATTCCGAARESWDAALALGEKHGYRNAQVTVIAPTGTIGLRDGLRHHRHRARLRAREVQEARRRRLLQDHQPVGPAGAAAARLHAPSRSTTIVRYARGAGTLDGAPARQPRDAARQGLHGRGAREDRGAAARRVRHLASCSTAGRSATTSCATRCGIPAHVLRGPAFDLLAPPRLRPRPDRAQANDYVCGTMTVEGAPHLKAEHLPGLRLREQVRPERQALHRRRWATSA